MTPTAMETNKNIDRLLAMLDHPEHYREQEIMDTVNRDDETREFYRTEMPTPGHSFEVRWA